MYKKLLIIFVLFIFFSCESDNEVKKEDKSVQKKYDSLTDIKLSSNFDKNLVGKIDKILVSVITTDREVKYAIMFGWETFDFASELEQNFNEILNSKGIEVEIYKSTGLELDNKKIDDIIKEKNIKYYLEIVHKSSRLLNDITIGEKYDIVLYDINNQAKIWRCQLEIEKQGFGFAGLTKHSAYNFAFDVINDLKKCGFID